MNISSLGWIPRIGIIIVLLFGVGCTPAVAPGPPSPTPLSTPSTSAVPPSPTLPPTPVPVLRVGLDAANRPWAYPDGKGGLMGLDIDVLAALGGEMGVRWEYVNSAPHLLLPGLLEGRYEVVINGLVVTPARQKQVPFSLPYFYLGQVVVVSGKGTNIRDLNDLAGKRIGAQLGTPALVEARKVGAQVRPYDDFSIALIALSRVEVDAVIADNLLVADYLRAHPELGLRIIGSPFAQEPVAVAVSPHHSDLLRRINEALTALKQRGILAYLESKWLGEPLSSGKR